MTRTPPHVGPPHPGGHHGGVAGSGESTWDDPELGYEDEPTAYDGGLQAAADGGRVAVFHGPGAQPQGMSAPAEVDSPFLGLFTRGEPGAPPARRGNGHPRQAPAARAEMPTIDPLQLPPLHDEPARTATTPPLPAPERAPVSNGSRGARTNGNAAGGTQRTPAEDGRAADDDAGRPVEALRVPVEGAGAVVEAPRLPAEAARTAAEGPAAPADGARSAVETPGAPVGGGRTPVGVPRTSVEAARPTVDTPSTSAEAARAPVDTPSTSADAARAPVEAPETPVEGAHAPHGGGAAGAAKPQDDGASSRRAAADPVGVDAAGLTG